MWRSNPYFSQSPYPIIPDLGDKLFQPAIGFHCSRPVPLRFSVIAGEVIHHLRSCLDHVVWQLSDTTYRRDHSGRIEFPVFGKMPKGGELGKYEEKVKGVAKAVRAVIDRLQPYRDSNPLMNPLWIIHQLDRLDKHRELLIVVSGVIRHYGQDELRAVVGCQMPESGIPLTRKQNALMGLMRQIKYTPGIAFKKVGDRENVPVVPAVTYLIECVVFTIEKFAEFFE